MGLTCVTPLTRVVTVTDTLVGSRGMEVRASETGITGFPGGGTAGLVTPMNVSRRLLPGVTVIEEAPIWTCPPTDSENPFTAILSKPLGLIPLKFEKSNVQVAVPEVEL